MLAADPILVTAPLALWTWIGATLIPILTAIVVAKVASPLLKALFNAVLVEAAAVVAYATLHEGKFDLESFVLTLMSALFVTWAAYAGFWRKTIVPKVESAVPGGLGSRSYSDAA